MEIKLKVDPCRESLIYYSVYGFRTIFSLFLSPVWFRLVLDLSSILLSSSLMEILKLPFFP